MDEEIRDLERRAAADPTAWPLVARARRRAGASPVELLAVVRAGLRADPASTELAAERDQALSAFWEAPSWRVLFERQTTGGNRIVFSPDGALLAAAGRGVVVVNVDANQIVNAGYAGRTVRSLTFLGRELLLDDEGLVHWDPVSERERARVPGTIPTIAVAVAPDSSRGFAVTENGRVLRLAIQRGRVTGTEPAHLLAPPPTAALGWTGRTAEQDRLILGLGARVVLRSGAAFEQELEILSSGIRILAGLDSLQYALVSLAAQSFELLAGRIALSPDCGATLVPGQRCGVLLCHTESRHGPRAVEQVPPTFRAAAFSPCGSRLAVLLEDRLTVLEAC